jgi:peptidoglycan/LPS O-acetylase OafA/YrhL
MNFGLDYRQAGSFSHAWSLCIEEQFYLLLPLIMLLALRLQLKRAFILCFLTSIFIFGFAIRAYSWQTYVSPLYGDGSQEASVGNIYSTWIYYPTYCRLDGLLVGILIALGFTFKPEMREKLWARSWIFLLLGLAILIATYFLYEEPFAFHTAILSYPFVSIGYGFILIACTNPSGKIQKLKLRVISYLATLSYSFYLVHKPINHITVSLLSAYDVNRTILFIICFICSLLAAMLLHYAVEKPFLKLREKFL